MTDYNQPAKGTEDWNQPLNENFGDLSIEVADEVATWGDLPSPTEVSQSSGGQWPVYRVAADDVYVRVTDSAQEIIGGLGSTDRPLPEQHVKELSAGEMLAGTPRRKLVSEQARTITVGTDVPTVQDAVKQIPVVVQHDYIIEVPDADYSSENVLVPPFVHQQAHPDDSEGHYVELKGNPTTPANVSIGSILATGVWGKRGLVVNGFQFEGAEPIGDAAPAWQIDAGTAIVRDCNFNDANGTGDRMMVSYGGTTIIKGKINGEKDKYKTVAVAKNQGHWIDETEGGLSATVTGNAYNCQAGTMAVDEQSSVSAGNSLYAGSRGPIYIFDSTNYNDVTVWGVSGISGDAEYFDMNGKNIRDPETYKMTSDPTTETPAGAVTLSISGTLYEIPYYTR